MAWLHQGLADGMSMAVEAARVVGRGGFAIRMLGDDGGDDQADLRYGRNLRLDLERVAVELVDDWPDGHLFVEMPFVRPRDSRPEGRSVSTVVCGDECYAYAPLDAESSTVARTLVAHDPTSLYVAAVVTARPGVDPRRCPTEALRTGIFTLEAVMVGAHDGEAFVVCSRQLPERNEKVQREEHRA
ncbi:MAG: hypothetical protein QM582_09070 [Micropruina sp.]|uniref:hypothetical protein n=1 Tax=Micropruina sp. TaxID=2737536 RepID=UPI0039E33C2D